MVGDLGGDAELHQVGVGANEGLLVAATLNLAGNLLDGAGAVIGDVVEDEAIDCHIYPPRVLVIRSKPLAAGQRARPYAVLFKQKGYPASSAFSASIG